MYIFVLFYLAMGIVDGRPTIRQIPGTFNVNVCRVDDVFKEQHVRSGRRTVFYVAGGDNKIISLDREENE